MTKMNSPLKRLNVIYLLNILFLVPAEASRLIGITIILPGDQRTRRSFWVFDTLMDLPLESNLVKAGVIGACFMFAWFAGTNEGKRGGGAKFC
jgi:hypothetical protein